MDRGEAVAPVTALRAEADRGASSGGSRLLAATFATQVVFLVALVAGGMALLQRLDALQSTTDRDRQELVEARSKIEALGEQTRQTNIELVSLRQTVASTTTEEVLFLKAIVLKRDIDLELARNVATLVHKQAAAYGRDPNLVLAIIAAESDFNPKVVSNMGATGLMQVMPHWKRVLGITSDLTDPETNIRAGLQILGFYLEMYQDLDIALTAYNRGPGPVDAALTRGVSANNGYAPKVLATYERLKQLNVATAPR
jgi:hypothetical protein